LDEVKNLNESNQECENKMDDKKSENGNGDCDKVENVNFGDDVNAG
jgi:hypothetical protein